MLPKSVTETKEGITQLLKKVLELFNTQFGFFD